MRVFMPHKHLSLNKVTFLINNIQVFNKFFFWHDVTSESIIRFDRHFPVVTWCIEIVVLPGPASGTVKAPVTDSAEPFHFVRCVCDVSGVKWIFIELGNATAHAVIHCNCWLDNLTSL